MVHERIEGFKFIIRPSVFNPVDFISSKIFASFIKSLNLTGKRIIDMGSGSGIVSVFAASGGAECLAVDINPVAVKCITENAAVNGLSGKITAVESDLFESLTEKSGRYSCIFFNPPYYKGIPKNNFERAFKAGPSLEVINNFLSGAGGFLNPEGKIYFIVSSDMDLNELKNIFLNHGFTFTVNKTINKFLETFYITESVIL